jgi:TctA family transporter
LLPGRAVGTLVGVLPGLGPVATIAMLLPATLRCPPESALIMLAGIYYGAQYGGSTTAILINLPGEASSVVTALDGYRMAQQGRAGAALATAAIGSFFAGTVATFVIAFMAPPLAALALQFQSPEYFSLMVLGLVASGRVGTGLAHQGARHDGDSGCCSGWSAPMSPPAPPASPSASPSLPTASTSSSSPWACSASPRSSQPRERSTRARSTSSVSAADADARGLEAHGGAHSARHALGSLLGILPGGGALLASFAAYSLEKKVSKHGAEFGRAQSKASAAPESANNAGAQTSFIPMLTLGIPSNPSWR